MCLPNTLIQIVHLSTNTLDYKVQCIYFNLKQSRPSMNTIKNNFLKIVQRCPLFDIESQNAPINAYFFKV